MSTHSNLSYGQFICAVIYSSMNSRVCSNKDFKNKKSISNFNVGLNIVDESKIGETSMR